MHWEEYPLAIKEEILANPDSHDDLIGSLRDSHIDLGGLEMDSIPGYLLIEPLHPGQSLNPVFLAIRDPAVTSNQDRHTVCIKIAISSASGMSPKDSRIQDCSEAITQEASALKELANVPELQGHIPKHLQDGTIAVGQERFKFLVTEYFFGVRNARPEDIKSLDHVRVLLDLVGCIHQHGFVHCDLTLENLLVTRSHSQSSDLHNQNKTWRIIDFGSAVRRPRWPNLSVTKRPVFAHRLAGALDEIRYACPIGAPYDVACLALLIQESTALQFIDAGNIPHELIRDFWEKAMDPRPEFRPACAHAFLRELDGLSQRTMPETGLRLWPWLRAGLRRNPKTVALAASMTASVAFAGTYAYYQRQLNQTSTALNNELSQTVDSLMKRNSSMVRKITELVVMDRIGVRQGNAQIDAVIDESLATWNNTKISPSVRITALRLLVDVSDSLMEFQKSDAAHACLTRTLEALENASGDITDTNPLVTLLEIRVKSKLVRLAVEYQHSIPSNDSAKSVSQGIIKEFLQIDLDPSSELLQREVLRCAENLLHSAIYVFKGSDWPLENPKATQLVYDHAIKNVDCTLKSLAIPLASLECQYGFMIHKGFLSSSGAQVSSYREFAKSVQQYYLAAQVRIQGVTENELNDQDSELLRELRSRIQNNLGMSYMQAREFNKAREVLQKAWVDRKQELALAPRSLIWLKRSANTAWNFADAYFSEIILTDQPRKARSLELHRSSLPSRYEAIELCQRWVELDRCKESETGYLVNVLRGFYLELDIGNAELGLELLHQAEKWITLQDPGPSHSFGDDILLAAALLHGRNPTNARYKDLYEDRLSAFRERLLTQMATEGQELQPGIRQRVIGFLRISQSDVFSGLVSDVRWQGIKELADRLVR
jgi:serine/threonine protein kinase